ncbi:large ribosomal subunit protein bL33m isoform X1 [Eretmochelys imbricata]|nr:39S ribosomal protein L33, mitochondrial isoform X1 [Caretta caretta]
MGRRGLLAVTVAAAGLGCALARAQRAGLQRHPPRPLRLPGRPLVPRKQLRPRPPEVVVAVLLGSGAGRRSGGVSRRSGRHVPDGGRLYILVRMVSAAGTGYCYNIKRARLQEKLVLLKYDPIVNQRVLFTEKRKIRSI